MSGFPDQATTSSIREEGSMIGDGVDGLEQPSNTFAFGDITAGAGRLRYIHHAGTLVHRQKKNSRFG